MRAPARAVCEAAHQARGMPRSFETIVREPNAEPHLTSASQPQRRPCLPPWGAAVIVASAAKRAEVQPRRAVGNVSDTRTSPTLCDRPTLVRPISDIALIASVAVGLPAPGRQPVPVTQLDLFGSRLARRLPCARRPPNARQRIGTSGGRCGHLVRNRRGIACSRATVPSAASCQTL